MPVLLFAAALVCWIITRGKRKSSERSSGKTSWQFLLWKNAVEFLQGVLVGTAILTIVWIFFALTDLDTKSLSTLRAIEHSFSVAGAVGKSLKGPAYAAVLVYVALFVLALLSVSRPWKHGRMLANIGLKCVNLYFYQVKRWTTPLAVLTSFTFLGGTLGSHADRVDFQLKAAKTSLEEIGKHVRQRIRQSVAGHIQSRVIHQQPRTYQHVIARYEQLKESEPDLQSRTAEARRYGVDVTAVENEFAARSARAQSADKAVEGAIEAETFEDPPPLKPEAERKVAARRLDQIQWATHYWARDEPPAQQLMEKLGKPLPGKVLSAVFTPGNIPVEMISHLASDYPVIGAFLQVFTSTVNDRIRSGIEPAVVKYVNRLIVEPPEKVAAELDSEARAIAESAAVEWNDDAELIAQLLLDVSKREAHLAKASNDIDRAVARKAAEIRAENERRLAALAPQIDAKIHVRGLLGNQIFFTSLFLDAIRSISDPIDCRHALTAASEAMEKAAPSERVLYQVVRAYLPERSRDAIKRVVPSLIGSEPDPLELRALKRLGEHPGMPHPTSEWPTRKELLPGVKEAQRQADAQGRIEAPAMKKETHRPRRSLRK